MTRPSSSDDRTDARDGTLINAAQLVRRHPRLRIPVVHGLLRLGETMNIVAQSKIGKSWLGKDLALAVATGGTWLRRFETTQGRVLYVDNELHTETLSSRIAAVAQAREIVLDKVRDDLMFASIRGRNCNLRALREPFERLVGQGFTLIVLDALYRLVPEGVNENDNAAMTGLYNLIDEYARLLNCAFAVIHHTSKGSQAEKSVTDVGAGAGAQSRAADTHLILRSAPDDEPDVATLQSVARSWKPLNAMRIRRIHPVWNVEKEFESPWIDVGRKKPKEKTARMTPEQFVTKYVTAAPRSREAIVSSARRDDVSARSAKGLLEEAESMQPPLVHRWKFGSNKPQLWSTKPQPVDRDDADDHGVVDHGDVDRGGDDRGEKTES